MAADAKSFGIALGVNAAIGTICFLFFCFMRLRRLMRKFYMPRGYIESTKTAGKPRALPRTFAGWIGPAWSTSEDELVRVAGYDAAMYIKILSYCFETLVWVALWALLIALPTNLVGKEVDNLSGTSNVPTSPFTYWVPPPSPPPGPNSPPAPQTVSTIKAPDFYAEVPPAPPGLQWWSYNPGVPPLPQPSEVLGPSYAGYSWRYNADYSAESYTFSTLDKVTMSNVSENSNLLWVHAIACYFVAWVVLRGLWRYCNAATALHLKYLSSAPRGAASHSVLVTDIPGTYSGTVKGFVPEKLRHGVAGGATKSGIPNAIGKTTNAILPSSVPASRRATEDDMEANLTSEAVTPASRAKARQPDIDAWQTAAAKMSGGMDIKEMVANEYEELFPGDVGAVHLVCKTASLDPHVKEYNGILRNLEDLLDDYASQAARGKEIKRKQTRVLGVKYGEWGRKNYPGLKPVKTDLMGWYVKRLGELRRLILEEQTKSSSKPESTAFVTFRSRWSQTVASNSLQHADVTAWHVSAAPEPGDVIWDNIRFRAWQRQLRWAVVWTLFTLLALFYSIPIGAVQAIIEVQRLQNIAGFKQLVSIPFIRSIIEAILPGLVLNIFLALLPLILSIMNRLQGMVAITQVDFGVVRKYFIFLVISVFLGSFIGGALFNQFNQWIENPTSAVTILGTAAPLTSIFFLTYIQLQAFTSLPLSFLRLIGLVVYWIGSRLAATPRAKARVWSQRRYKFGPQLPRHMLILFVALVFSIINPLVPAMALVYFAVALLTERYNMLYIFTPMFDGGGKMWREVYEQIMTSMIFFEVIMIALLAIKKSYSAILLAPLLVITVIFWAACRPVFKLPMSVLSLRTAADLDYNDKLAEEEIPLEPSAAHQPEEMEHENRKTYLMPALDFDEAKHEAILREAENMDLVLQGKRELELVDDAANGHDVEEGETEGSESMATITSRKSLVPPNQGDSASLANIEEEGPGVSLMRLETSPDSARKAL